jgi:DNA polymerase-3 subunit gamma/tau
MTSPAPYLVLARKYRPQRFGEMSGQEHVVRTLSNAIARGQIAHAFLFTGPRGVGKTTTARLVAKALNCEKGPTAEPCGVCTPCLEISEGRAVDVVEIDAASNNGVDNVRDIVEAVKYRPARDRYKVFVVDEVHMLSQGAFNALLKTLEEPPEHVKFVLATTDVHKVPETILSRCQRFDFRRLTLQQISDQLAKVADSEGMRLSPAALALVARQAEGGMRDALSLLDQIRAACGDAPEDAAVAEALGAVDAAAVSRLSAALVHRDGAAVLAEIGALHARGLEMRRVAEELVRHLRNVVVAKLVPSTPLDLPDAELAEVRAQAEAADAAQLTRLFDLVQEAVQEVKESDQPRYTLEVALLEGVFLAPGAQVAELIARLEALAKGGALPPARSGPTAAAPPAGAPAGGGGREVAKHAPSLAEGFGTPGCAAGSEPGGWRPLPGGIGPGSPNATPNPTASPTASPTPSPTPRHASSHASDAERWRAAVEEVEKASAAVASMLKQAALRGMSDGELAIQLPTPFLAQAVERRRADVEPTLSRFFGRPTRLAVSVGAVADAPAASGAPAESQPLPSIAAAEAAERQARSARLADAARNHPNIQDAARILDGRIDEIEEL